MQKSKGSLLAIALGAVLIPTRICIKWPQGDRTALPMGSTADGTGGSCPRGT